MVGEAALESASAFPRLDAAAIRNVASHIELPLLQSLLHRRGWFLHLMTSVVNGPASFEEMNIAGGSAGLPFRKTMLDWANQEFATSRIP